MCMFLGIYNEIHLTNNEGNMSPVLKYLNCFRSLYYFIYKSNFDNNVRGHMYVSLMYYLSFCPFSARIKYY